MSNKFKVFCRITDYLEQHHPRVHQLVQGLCLFNAINGTKQKPGVTLVVPTEESLISKIEKLAHSSDIADTEKAANMILAMIFQDKFVTPSDWSAKKPVINMQFPPQIVEISSGTGNSVTFKSGAIAEPAKTFIDGTHKKKLAVWVLKSGEIPPTNDKPADRDTMKKLANTKAPISKAGGYQPTLTDMQSVRFKIAMLVENQFVLKQKSVRGGGWFLGSVDTDPYCDAVCSLICVIGDDAFYNKDLLADIAPIISWGKMDFYFLVEPHKLDVTNYLIPDDVIDKWWNHNQTFNPTNCYDRARSLITQACARGSAATLNTNGRAKLHEAVREEIGIVTQAQMAKYRTELIPAIRRVYTQLETQNAIGSVKKVLPERLCQYYSAQPGLKMLHDELRYIGRSTFETICSGAFDDGKFNWFVNKIGDVLRAVTEEERKVQHILLSESSARSQIQPVEIGNEIGIFVNSVFFVYFHREQNELEGIAKFVTVKPREGVCKYYNPLNEELQLHQRILGDAGVNSELVRELKKLPNIPAEIMAIINNY